MVPNDMSSPKRGFLKIWGSTLLSLPRVFETISSDLVDKLPAKNHQVWSIPTTDVCWLKPACVSSSTPILAVEISENCSFAGRIPVFFAATISILSWEIHPFFAVDSPIFRWFDPPLCMVSRVLTNKNSPFFWKILPFLPGKILFHHPMCHVKTRVKSPSFPVKSPSGSPGARDATRPN